MALVNLARDMLADAITGGSSYTKFTNAAAHIGVGNSATAYAATQTDLIGASKFRQPMEATYPSRAANVLTFRSLFATGDANFAWDEWGIFNASAASQMLSRKVEALGTKTSAVTRQVTATITIAIG